MEHLEKRDKIFASPALTEAWARALLRHPIAYLEHSHRLHGRHFCSSSWNMTMWSPRSRRRRQRSTFADNPRLMTLKGHSRCAEADAGILRRNLAAARHHRMRFRLAGRRQMPGGSFRARICGSAIVYMATFFTVGVAPISGTLLVGARWP